MRWLARSSRLEKSVPKVAKNGKPTKRGGDKKKSGGPKGPADETSKYAEDPAYVELKAAQRAYADFLKKGGEYTVTAGLKFTPDTVPDSVGASNQFRRLDKARTCWFRRKAEFTAVLHEACPSANPPKDEDEEESTSDGHA